MTLTLALLIIATAAGFFLTLNLALSKRPESRILAIFTGLLAAFSSLQLTVELRSVLMLYLPFLVFPAIFLQGVIIHSYTRKLLGAPLYRQSTLAGLSLPALIALAFQIAMFVRFAEFRDVNAVYSQQGMVKAYTAALFIFAMSYNLVFLWLSYRLLGEKSKSQSASGSHLWLRIFFSFNAVLSVAGFTNILYNIVADVAAPANPFTAILLTGGNYLILTFLIRKPAIFDVSDDRESQKQNGKYAKIQSLDELTKRQYVQRIHQHLTSEQGFLDDSFSLKQLSEQLGIAPHLISMVINTELQQNFYALINSYRVNKAKELLMATAQPNILEVAYASGFKSKSAFNKVFKQLTGQTPSEFKNP